MSESRCILLVEDEPIQMELAAALLEPHYTVVRARDSDEALHAFHDRRPDLVLMDKRLPGINGVQLCRQLREETATEMPPVLFVSAEITLDDRLAAYSAGGEDYITKPFEPAELLAKIDIALRNVDERRRLEGSAKSAFNTAMTAMSSASEIGVVLQTLRESFQAKSLTALCQSIITACDHYQIKAVAQIRSDREIVTLNQNGVASALEMETLTALADRGRIISARDHAAFNYGKVTLLVGDLDPSNEARTGRMRDNLALIAEAIDVRASALENEQALMREFQHTLKLFATSTAALQKIDHEFQQQFVEVRMALANMIEGTEKACFSLGLTESQENLLSQQLHLTESKLLAIFERGLAVEAHLSELQKMMEARVAERN